MSILFHLKYHSEEWDFSLSDDATVNELETRVFQLTHVEPNAQKLLGLFNRKPTPPKSTPLRACLGVKLAPRVNKLTLMGVTREEREKIQLFEATMVAEREAEREAELEAAREAERVRLAAEARAEEARVAAAAALAQRMERERREQEAAEERRRIRRAQRAERARRDELALLSEQSNSNSNSSDESIGDREMTNASRLNQSFDDDASVDDVELRVVSATNSGVVGDKVLLPHSLLVALDNSRVRPPYVFRVTLGERSVHVRALDFTAAERRIVMSPHLLEDLGAENGALVKIDSVRLPPATKLQLQPSPSWIDLEPELRDAILHYELRNYATATLGGSLNVRYANELFSFRVCDVEPKSALACGVSLSDVDVEVDVIEPATLPPAIAALQIDAAATVDCVASKTTPAYFSLQFADADVGQRFRVSVQSSTANSDPDLFASQLMKRPSAVAYEWQAQLDGVNEELLLVCGDGAAQVRPNAPLYVAVTTYGSDVPCTFSIALQRVVAENRLNGDGQVVLDGIECVWCGRKVPRATHALHELGCQRDNYVCKTCNETMPRRSRAKHETVRHQQVQCSLGCGAMLSQDEQATHRRETCRLRAVSCLYCPMQVSLLERGAHQNQCGNRTATCKRCQFTAKRNTLKRHVVEAHGVFPKDVHPNDWH
jgi:hypothetical protein